MGSSFLQPFLASTILEHSLAFFGHLHISNLHMPPFLNLYGNCHSLAIFTKSFSILTHLKQKHKANTLSILLKTTKWLMSRLEERTYNGVLIVLTSIMVCGSLLEDGLLVLVYSLSLYSFFTIILRLSQYVFFHMQFLLRLHSDAPEKIPMAFQSNLQLLVLILHFLQRPMGCRARGPNIG